MAASAEHHEQLLAGLLRGDGDGDVHTGPRSYTKAGRSYCHEFNSGQVGYFSSSPTLLAQAEVLLRGLGFHPSKRNNKPHLRITGGKSLDRLSGLIGGAKGERLERVAASRLRTTATRNMKPWAGGSSLPVVGVTPFESSGDVYSLEVEGTHTFATTGGVFVHNCIPIDPFYLTWVARRYGVNTRFIELAGEVNTAMPNYVVERVAAALNEHARPVKGSRVCVLGVAYKKDVDDPRESPAFEIIEALQRRGADLSYHDPHVPATPRMRRHSVLLESRPLTEQFLAEQDCVLIVTDHTAVDYQFVVDHSRLVVDTRNATAKCRPGKAQVWKA
jgi:hypothetical protein